MSKENFAIKFLICVIDNFGKVIPFQTNWRNNHGTISIVHYAIDENIMKDLKKDVYGRIGLEGQYYWKYRRTWLYLNFIQCIFEKDMPSRIYILFAKFFFDDCYLFLYPKGFKINKWYISKTNITFFFMNISSLAFLRKLKPYKSKTSFCTYDF